MGKGDRPLGGSAVVSLPLTTQAAGECGVCGAVGVPVSLTCTLAWRPVLQCDDVDACWDRRAGR